MYLTAKSTGERVRIPILPDRVNVKSGAKTTSTAIISIGDVKIPRGSTLTGYSWNGMLPGEHLDGSSIVREWVAADAIIKTLKSFEENGTQLTLMITDVSVNDDVFIESFNYEYFGGFGDVSYTITLSKWRDLFVTTVPPQPVNPTPPTGGDNPTNGNKTGTINLSKKNGKVAVRQKASKKSKKLGTLKNGTTVEIVKLTGNWYEIVYKKGKNGTAFVYVSYVKVNDTSSGGSDTNNGAGTNGTKRSTYTVKSGDTLTDIAKAMLGDISRYIDIYNLNKAAIDAKNKGKTCSKYTVYAGMTLKLPT